MSITERPTPRLVFISAMRCANRIVTGLPGDMDLKHAHLQIAAVAFVDAICDALHHDADCWPRDLDGGDRHATCIAPILKEIGL